jgi:hypothetical protein
VWFPLFLFADNDLTLLENDLRSKRRDAMSKATNLVQIRPCGSAWASREQQEIGGKAMCKRMKWNQANHLVRAVLLILLPVGVALLTPPALHAQTVSFAGIQTTVGSGLHEPTGVAADGVGDVFIADAVRFDLSETVGIVNLEVRHEA